GPLAGALDRSGCYTRLFIAGRNPRLEAIWSIGTFTRGSQLEHRVRVPCDRGISRPLNLRRSGLPTRCPHSVQHAGVPTNRRADAEWQIDHITGTGVHDLRSLAARRAPDDWYRE